MSTLYDDHLYIYAEITDWKYMTNLLKDLSLILFDIWLWPYDRVSFVFSKEDVLVFCEDRCQTNGYFHYPSIS